MSVEVEQDRIVEIVGGLSLKDVAAGGAEFEVKPIPPTHSKEQEDEEDLKYLDVLEGHTNLACMDGYEESELEPFECLAKKMTPLIPSGKIKKRILREGYGNKPFEQSTVKIDYNAYKQNDAHPFDSTYARRTPHHFQVDSGEVIEGLDLAVQSMKINEKSQFLIDPELAYKDSGFDRIPPNSTVLFEIEMRDMHATTDKPQSREERDAKDFASVYKLCSAICIKGKNMFRQEDYNGAIKEYLFAVNKLENTIMADYSDQEKSDKLLVKLHTNLLICYTLLKVPKKGCVNANKVYEIARGGSAKATAKVYFNNAKCLLMLGDFAEAKRRLTLANKLEPGNSEILNEFQVIEKARQEYFKKDVAMAKAFAGATIKKI